jgi:hypothetical protein
MFRAIVALGVFVVDVYVICYLFALSVFLTIEHKHFLFGKCARHQSQQHRDFFYLRHPTKVKLYV